MKVSVFTQGKNPPKNEDTAAYDTSAFVVCDGSTGKKDGLYQNRTGGEIASSLVAAAALKSELNGLALIDHLTTVLRKKETQLQHLGHDVELETTIVCARIVGTNLIVTQAGDTAFRINTAGTHENPAVIATLMAETRSRYIALTGDVQGGREYIMPLLLSEHVYRNNADKPAGYGVIDGTKVPAKFVKFYEFDLKDIHTLEIYTDGYFAVPKTASIESYEKLHAKVQQKDPHKYLNYPSTKSNDDRTVMIVEFN